MLNQGILTCNSSVDTCWESLSACFLISLLFGAHQTVRYIIVTLCRCWRYCNMWRICMLWKNIGRHLYKVIKYELSLELNHFVIYGGISWDDLLILMECHKREIWWNLQIFSGWSNVWLELLPRHHLLESSSHRLPAAVVTSTAESGFLAEFPGGLSWRCHKLQCSVLMVILIQQQQSQQIVFLWTSIGWAS